MKHVMLLAWMLSGCSAVYNGVYNYEEGWREAVVENLAPSAEQTAQASLDCRSSAPQERYILVRYEIALRPRHAVVAMQEGLKQQSRMYLNIRDCRLVMAPEAPTSRD